MKRRRLYQTLLDGLQLAWVPSLDVDGTMIRDRSPNGAHGIFTNMEAGDNDIFVTRRCIYVGGTDEYIVSNASNFLQAASNVEKYTMSCWTWLSAGNSAAICLNNTSRRFGIWNYNAGTAYFICDASGGASYGYANLTLTGWHHVVMSYNGSESSDATKLVGYVDGVKQTLTFAGFSVPTSLGTQTTFEVGKLLTSYYVSAYADVICWDRALTYRYWAGAGTDAMAWDRALTAEQVKAIYDLGPGGLFKFARHPVGKRSAAAPGGQNNTAWWLARLTGV
jgi:hypothetical protein